MTVTKEEKLANLTKLADFIENEVKDEQFDMSWYRQTFDKKRDRVVLCQFISKNDCGTVGCALGWGPWVVPPIFEDFRSGELAWDRYCDNHFFDDHSDDYDYLFSSSWTDREPGASRMDAVGRIRHYVKHDGDMDFIIKNLGGCI